jgi:hypothetical protein
VCSVECVQLLLHWMWRNTKSEARSFASCSHAAVTPDVLYRVTREQRSSKSKQPQQMLLLMLVPACNGLQNEGG